MEAVVMSRGEGQAAMMFRDEIVENIKEVAELRLSDLLTDEEFAGRVETLMRQYRQARGFARGAEPEPLPETPPIGPDESLFALHIHSPTGNQQRSEFPMREITIGRSSESDLILRRNDISRRHARILMRDGRFILLDLKSENGTYVNGRRIGSPQVVKPGDCIAIGDYEIYIEALDQTTEAQDP